MYVYCYRIRRSVSTAVYLLGNRMCLNTRNKFWEQLIAYSALFVNLVSDTTRRKKTLVCFRNEINKIIQEFIMVAVNRNEVFIYFLNFTHVTTCFGPCGPSSNEHYRFLEASFCL
jgi:hypothetical protein